MTSRPLAALHAMWRVVGDLPGEWRIDVSDEHSDVFVRNLLVVRVTQRLPAVGVTYGAYAYLPRGMEGEEVTFALDSLRRAFRPWERPDRNPLPSFAPFPRIGACEAAWRRFVRRWRCSARRWTATP